MTFYEDFILSCYKVNYPMRTSTLYHLLKGKKTTSVLSYGYFYNKLPYFNLLPKLKEITYYNAIDVLIHNKFLKELESGVVQITKIGLAELDIVEFPSNVMVNQLGYYKFDFLFWEKLLFTTQVISEKAYKESKYIPIETNLFKQQQLKFWLKKQESHLTQRFYEEWTLFLDYLPEDKQELLLGQLVGHDEIGSTLNQLADSQHKDYLFMYLEFKNILHFFIDVIETNSVIFPIFHDLLELEKSLVKVDSNLISSQLYRQYQSIPQVSQFRNLKESTVTDHLIETFLLNPTFNNLPKIRETTINTLNELKVGKKDFRRWKFKDAKVLEPTLSFFDFRFYQFYLIEMEKLNG